MWLCVIVGLAVGGGRRCVYLQESAYFSVPSSLKKLLNSSSVTFSPLNMQELLRRYVGTHLQNTRRHIPSGSLIWLNVSV